MIDCFVAAEWLDELYMHWCEFVGLVYGFILKDVLVGVPVDGDM